MAMFAAIGSWLGASASTATAVGATATALAAGSIGSSIYSASQASRKPSVPELPQTPTVKDAEINAKEASRQKRIAASRSKSIFTSPLGIGGEAQGARKTLLGE